MEGYPPFKRGILWVRTPPHPPNFMGYKKSERRLFLESLYPRDSILEFKGTLYTVTTIGDKYIYARDEENKLFAILIDCFISERF